MAVQLALPRPLESLKGRVKLPDAVPPFSNRFYRLFWAIWLAAFLLALIGPAAGLYYRYARPDNNSLLMLGSRAGIAVSDNDATRIRFTVGPYTRDGGIRPGDDIIAIYGLPVPDVVPVTEADLARNQDDPIYVAFADLLYGSDNFDALLRIRSPDGRERDVVIHTGDQHIAKGARELGIAPELLSYLDLLHVVTYPFLLWAAWILHRRNARDAVSSILSLAVLLTMGTEEPSATALAIWGAPRWLHVFIFDIGNICLLAGILLFPHGKLSPRLIAILAALPVLMLLHGDAYRATFMAFMIAAVLMLVGCLRLTQPGDMRQQIKWALYGFSSYAFFFGIALTGDMLKTLSAAFSHQLLIELLSGLAMGLAFLTLQLGLLVALLRYRLYDAEAVISRTASFAIVTLVLGAGFAGVMEGIITSMQSFYADSQTTAAMVGAVMATVLVHPLHQKVQVWAERRFHKNLLQLREGVPELMRDLREVADVDEFLQEILTRINAGVYAVRSAVIVDRGVQQVAGISQADALRWLISFKPAEGEDVLECNPEDPIFPVRVRLGHAAHQPAGWLLIGPRPDGSLAGGDERDALREIADPFARALRIVLKREADKQEVTDLLDAFRLRIEQLEHRLSV